MISSENIQSLGVDDEIGKPEVKDKLLSDDGKLLAIATYEELAIYQVGVKKPYRTVPIPEVGYVSPGAFNSNNTLLAYQSYGGEINILNLVEGKVAITLPKGTCWGDHIQFSDDDSLLIADCEYDHDEWNLNSGELSSAKKDSLEIVESPDGLYHLYSDQTSIRLANLHNEIIKTFEYPDKYPTEYLFNQDGTLVFIAFVYVDTVELNKPLPISTGQVWGYIRA